MTTTADTVPLDVRVRRGVVDELLLLVLAGIPTGALVAGLGSRLAMLILRSDVASTGERDPER